MKKLTPYRRAMEAMMRMGKIEIAEVERAADVV